MLPRAPQIIDGNKSKPGTRAANRIWPYSSAATLSRFVNTTHVKKPLTCGNTVPEVGLETALQPLKTLGSATNMRSQGRTGPYTSGSDAKSVDIVNTFLRPQAPILTTVS
jgi:hypothetical protein